MHFNHFRDKPPLNSAYILYTVIYVMDNTVNCRVYRVKVVYVLIMCKLMGFNVFNNTRGINVIVLR